MISYPINVAGGDFANTHILVNKDTILQLRSALIPDFEPAPIPNHISVALTIPRQIYEPPAMPETTPELTTIAPPVATPELAPVSPVTPEAIPAQPVAVPVSPVAAPAVPAAVGAQPAAAATPVAAVPATAPVGATPVAGVAPVAPVAAVAVPAVVAAPAEPAIAAVTPGAEAPAEETPIEDDMTIEFEDDDMEWE